MQAKQSEATNVDLRRTGCSKLRPWVCACSQIRKFAKFKRAMRPCCMACFYSVYGAKVPVTCVSFVEISGEASLTEKNA